MNNLNIYIYTRLVMPTELQTIHLPSIVTKDYNIIGSIHWSEQHQLYIPYVAWVNPSKNHHTVALDSFSNIFTADDSPEILLMTFDPMTYFHSVGISSISRWMVKETAILAGVQLMRRLEKDVQNIFNILGD